VIVVDTSAIVAILLGEEGESAFREQIELAGRALVSAVSAVELAAVAGRADALFESASGMDLSAGQADLIARAQHHYDIYNFYDALRFLEAALSG